MLLCVYQPQGEILSLLHVIVHHLQYKYIMFIGKVTFAVTDVFGIHKIL